MALSACQHPPQPSWQGAPPRMGEGCRAHMTFPWGPGQLLGCQPKPGAERGLASEPCSGRPAACILSLLRVCLAGRGTFLPIEHQ